MTERQITNRAKKLQELESQKAALEKQIDALKDEIQKEMGESETLTAGEYIIRWTKQVSNRFNSTAFKKDLPELYNKYLKPSESRRFSIVTAK